jgi:hypothetical protein
MLVEYDQVSIIVFTENSRESQKYFNLFRLILNGQIIREINHKDRKELDTDNLKFKFLPKSMQSRGHKAHYVLNLTQDTDFANNVAMPITIIHNYLKEDEKWSMLFEGMEN